MLLMRSVVHETAMTSGTYQQAKDAARESNPARGPATIGKRGNRTRLAGFPERTFTAGRKLLAATKHVRVLEAAKLVRRRVVGREHLCRLHAAPLKDATRWTEQFRQHWEARFSALDSLLDEMKSEEQSRRRRA
jgi:hypothetical protein